VWDEIVRLLPSFESAVLTGVDADGYPYSVRCKPAVDSSARLLRVQLPTYASIQAGQAGLLCHSHDENLWNLESFLVRGVLVKDAGGWRFEPGRFIPGIGIGGLPAMIRFFLSSRRKASRYLKVRNLARPSIPWDEINAARKAVSDQPSAVSQKEELKAKS
jgi:hypothetical protein